MLIFHDLIDDMASSLASPKAEHLILLIERVRPSSSHDPQETHHRLQRLIETLRASPERAGVVRDYILTLLTQYHQVSLYADSGILDHSEFGSALRQRIGWRILPPPRQTTYLHGLFQQCFYKSNDWRWIEHIKPEDWQQLFTLLSHNMVHSPQLTDVKSRLLSAIMIVSYRITAIGLEPELIRAYPAINEFKSPFLVQNREIIDYVEAFKAQLAHLDAHPIHTDQLDTRPALVMLDQCREIMNRVKRHTRKQGVSLGLTNLLIRLDQCLTRIELLLSVLAPDPTQAKTALAQMLRSLTRAQADTKSVRALIAINTELLARQVTENASRRGEHYVSNDRQGYWRMYRSAAGAGLIIASMATLKTLTGRLVLAPFSRAFLYSMNYSFGFMLIHMLQFTVATKQPAMTAAALAATLQNNNSSRQAQVAELAELTVNIMRTQFIAILGNISIAMPTGLLIAWLWQHQLHEPLLTSYKAEQLLHDINPMASLALFHAAIAGVWLFVSGLIAGYYDNLAVYHQIGPRLRQHPRLERWLGQPRLDRMAGYVENNLGALAGNFWFGIMLGSTGMVGYMLGLPIDIRHIAFASANFSQALFCIDPLPSVGMILLCLSGVILIGMTNLLVSFSLTLFVALRSRRVQYAQWRPLMQLLVTHFLTRPSDFFWPPRHLREHVRHDD